MSVLTTKQTGVAGYVRSYVSRHRRTLALHCRILTIDMQATIITANGKALTFSESENVDLFWGIRGGGNSHKKYDLNAYHFLAGKLLISARTISHSSAIQALHLQPADKAVVYNIAMIQQKSAELLFSLQPHILTDLERSIAQKMFGSLVADPASTVPYD